MGCLWGVSYDVICNSSQLGHDVVNEAVEGKPSRRVR